MREVPQAGEPWRAEVVAADELEGAQARRCLGQKRQGPVIDECMAQHQPRQAGEPGEEPQAAQQRPARRQRLQRREGRNRREVRDGAPADEAEADEADEAAAAAERRDGGQHAAVPEPKAPQLRQCGADEGQRGEGVVAVYGDGGERRPTAGSAPAITGGRSTSSRTPSMPSTCSRGSPASASCPASRGPPVHCRNTALVLASAAALRAASKSSTGALQRAETARLTSRLPRRRAAGSTTSAGPPTRSLRPRGRRVGRSRSHLSTHGGTACEFTTRCRTAAVGRRADSRSSGSARYGVDSGTYPPRPGASSWRQHHSSSPVGPRTAVPPSVRSGATRAGAETAAKHNGGLSSSQWAGTNASYNHRDIARCVIG